MSDKDLSIDEIIKRAEEIKLQAEKQLEEAEKSLNQKAKVAIDKVTVDPKAVLEKIEALTEEEEDVKEFTPVKEKKDKTQRFQTIITPLPMRKNDGTKAFPKIKKDTKKEEPEENDDDIKIAGDIGTKRIYFDKEKALAHSGDSFDDGIYIDQKTKPVVIKVNNSSDDEGELDEAPTLIARENLNSYLQNDDEIFDEMSGIQISFDGFSNDDEEVPTIDEEEAEKILEEQRKDKINKFRVFGPDKTDEELGREEYEGKDYKDEKEKSDILANLFNKKALLQVRIISTLVLGAVMLLLVVFKGSAYFPSILSSNFSFSILNLTLLVLTLITNINILIHGFKLKKGINSDFPTAIMSAVVLAHSVGLTISDDLWIENGVFFGPALAFAMLLSQMGKRQIMSRIIDNFDFIISSENTYTIENIVNQIDVQIISRGVFEQSDPIIKTSVKTDFPTNFMEISCKNEPSDRLCKIVSPISIILSVAIFVVVGLLDSFITGINMAVAGLVISTPIAIIFLMNNFLCDMSAQLDKTGARICGFEGAVMANNTDAIVMEASSLFGKTGCDLHGIKVFNKTKLDDAIVYAAAVIIQTKSPLSHVFDDVIIGKQSILPKVDKVVYEDTLGTSAWIYQRRVLVGNRNLLIHHGVSVPKESFEHKYTSRGRKAVYLAVNGKVMAMFVVSYSADPEIKRELKKLENTGVTLIVKSCDPYINEESISNLFGLPKGYVRVMNYTASRVFDRYSDMHVENSPAYMVHDGSAVGFISGMRGAGAIVSARKTINFLVAFGCALGFITVLLMSLFKGYSQINCLTIIGFQAIWNIFVYIIAKMKQMIF